MIRQAVSTDNAPPAIGPYSQAIVANGFVFCSGTVGIDPATGVVPDGIEEQTEQALRNLDAILATLVRHWRPWSRPLSSMQTSTTSPLSMPSMRVTCRTHRRLARHRPTLTYRVTYSFPSRRSLSSVPTDFVGDPAMRSTSTRGCRRSPDCASMSRDPGRRPVRTAARPVSAEVGGPPDRHRQVTHRRVIRYCRLLLPRCRPGRAGSLGRRTGCAAALRRSTQPRSTPATGAKRPRT